MDNVVEALKRRDIVSLDEEKFRQAWKDLESEDAVNAHRAIWALIGADDQTVAFMEKRAGYAVAGPDLGKLAMQLDSDDFPSREAATKKLTETAPLQSRRRRD